MAALGAPGAARHAKPFANSQHSFIMITKRLLQAAIAYFLVGIALGMYMGIAQDFRLRHVHVHFNLLGWVPLALMGLMYQAFPAFSRGWIPRAHFWLHNAGLLTFMGGFAASVLTDNKYVAPIAGGATLVSVAVALWAWHVLTCLKNKTSFASD